MREKQSLHVLDQLTSGVLRLGTASEDIYEYIERNGNSVVSTCSYKYASGGGSIGGPYPRGGLYGPGPKPGGPIIGCPIGGPIGCPIGGPIMGGPMAELGGSPSMCGGGGGTPSGADTKKGGGCGCAMATTSYCVCCGCWTGGATGTSCCCDCATIGCLSPYTVCRREHVTPYAVYTNTGKVMK